MDTHFNFHKQLIDAQTAKRWAPPYLSSQELCVTICMMALA